MANEMRGSPEIAARSRAGRKKGIDDGYLRLTRDSLVWLLEFSWGDIGWGLQTIKSPVDVPTALKSWEQHRDKYVVQCLLRPSDKVATAKKLNAMRRRLAHLNQSVRDAYELQRQRRESLERAERALATQPPEAEKEVIVAEREKRLQVLRSVEAEHMRVKSQHERLEQELRDGEAYFAQNELLRFRKSRRYTLNPLNTANALAGLPFIGWRQSAKRCRQWPSANANGLAYQMFNIIRRIVDSQPARADLTTYARGWLGSKRSSSPNAITQLRQDWYFLRRAIESVLRSNPRAKALSYRIFAEYLRRSSARTAADLLFEEEERIV